VRPRDSQGVTTFTIAWEHGPLRGAVTPRGLALLAFPGSDWDEPVARLASEHGGARADDRHPAARELRAYLDGSLRAFTVPIDLSLATPFAQRVLTKLCDVPFGELTTYGALAAAAGRPGGARAVGGAVGANPVPIVVPCHRVVASNGLGGFGGGLAMKRALLAIEGVDVRDLAARRRP
jgi:methylated-DNA-[protein]-cysteine S-methyltransferase